MSNENTEEIYGLETLEAKRWYRIKRIEITNTHGQVPTMQMVEEMAIEVDGKIILSGDKVILFTFDMCNQDHQTMFGLIDKMWKESQVETVSE